jgi:DNA repair protein RadC
MDEIGVHDRPREKLARHGAAALGDNELLAIVLGHGTATLDVLALANRALQQAGGVHGLMRLGGRHLSAVTGLGPAQAARVQAAIELGRRTLTVSASARPRFLNPHDLALYLLPQFGSHPVERFGVVLLDSRNRLIATKLVSVGLLDATAAHPREVFREALVAGAAGLAVFHNHPSGDPTPSAEDIAVTRRLKHAGEIVGVDLVDHVILADTHFCSLSESRLL